MALISGFTAVLVGIISIYVLLYRLQLRRGRPDEPPVVAAPGLPFVGHVLCMALQGGRYLQQLGLRLQQHSGLRPEFDSSGGGSSISSGARSFSFSHSFFSSSSSSPSWASSSSSEPSAGIVTLPVPGSRIYLVTDPSLAAAVQRASRAMSFTPLVPDVTRRVLGLDDCTVRIVRGTNLAVESTPRPSARTSLPPAGNMSIVDDDKYDESYGFLADMHSLVYSYMGPGENLARLVHTAGRELVAQVNDYAAGMAAADLAAAANGTPTPAAPVAPPVVDLLAWIKHFVTVGTARFLYGARNPLAVQPELEPAFWDFVHGLGRLLLVGDCKPGSLAASLLGGRPYAAREALVSGFAAYLEADEHLKGSGSNSSDSDDDTGCSDIVRRRIAIADRYGWARGSTARSELSFLFAGIINTAVTSFWVVLRLFADPALLATVRQELGDDRDDAAAASRDSLSIDHVRNNCPTLNAVYQECLRLGSNNLSTRLVLADTMLADRYFLRAGSVVQIAAGVIHADPAQWGPDAAVFDPTRFMPKTAAVAVGEEGKAVPAKTATTATTAANTARPAEPKRHPAALRAFGGGKTLCPGRHFATSEILVFAAAIVLSFDAESAQSTTNGDASNSRSSVPVPPSVPRPNDRVLPVHILEPAPGDSPQVRLRLRRSGQPLKVVV